MTSKRSENINLVSFICLSFLVVSFSKQLLIKYCLSIIFKHFSFFFLLLNISIIILSGKPPRGVDNKTCIAL